jgi:hypothetical protein
LGNTYAALKGRSSTNYDQGVLEKKKPQLAAAVSSLFALAPVYSKTQEPMT